MNLGGYALSVILSALCALVLGLTCVWLNIERVDAAYGLKQLQSQVDATEAHRDKLLVERDKLVSPYRLRGLAEEYGLGPAAPGQVRRMD